MAGGTNIKVNLQPRGFGFSQEILKCDLDRARIAISNEAVSCKEFKIVPTNLKNISEKYTSLLNKWKFIPKAVKIDEDAQYIIEANDYDLAEGVKPIK